MATPQKNGSDHLSTLCCIIWAIHGINFVDIFITKPFSLTNFCVGVDWYYGRNGRVGCKRILGIVH